MAEVVGGFSPVTTEIHGVRKSRAARAVRVGLVSGFERLGMYFFIELNHYEHGRKGLPWSFSSVEKAVRAIKEIENDPHALGLNPWVAGADFWVENEVGDRVWEPGVLV